MEWRYAFDIHCNAFLPFFLLASVLHYFLLPLLLPPSLVALILSNGLFAVAFALYFYITHLGYRGPCVCGVFLPPSLSSTHPNQSIDPRAKANPPTPNTHTPLDPRRCTALPFLHKTEVFLYPSGLALVLFVLFLLVGLLGEPYRISATRVMAAWYFRQ